MLYLGTVGIGLLDHRSESRSEPSTGGRRSPLLLRDLPVLKSFSNAGFAHYGFGIADNASRNAARLLLSTTAVPVSTQVGNGAVGAVRQSLNSFTALWCRSSRNFSP